MRISTFRLSLYTSKTCWSSTVTLSTISVSPLTYQLSLGLTLVFLSTHSSQLSVGLFLFCFGFADPSPGVSEANRFDPATTDPFCEPSVPLTGLKDNAAITGLSSFGVSGVCAAANDPFGTVLACGCCCWSCKVLYWSSPDREKVDMTSKPDQAARFRQQSYTRARTRAACLHERVHPMEIKWIYLTGCHTLFPAARERARVIV